MTTSSHHKNKILELIRPSAVVFQAFEIFFGKKLNLLLMLQETVFGMIIGNTMLFFLYDSWAAKNPEVKL